MIINPNTAKDWVQGIAKDALQPNTIDLTLKKIATITNGGRILAHSKADLPLYGYVPCDNGIYSLSPGAYSVDFNEYVCVPENVAGIIICRSSLNRIGAFITSGLYDTGFRNYIGAVLRTEAAIELQVGARIATMIFVDAQANSMYSGRYQEKEG